jgi:hypothetical protein
LGKSTHRRLPFLDGLKSQETKTSILPMRGTAELDDKLDTKATKERREEVKDGAEQTTKQATK